ncbi:TolC family protein [Fulvivirga sp. RKSG066]|uniref:TolC family protein n=1 Tax=Fulvivirga aurantia TaxID=2529383 RepID=UPI0012BC4FF2|nr:TolC family protein [Fulvivirga aurantia]MTI21355.1 TolC family protein [Fulvivirga aurantia]
MRKFTIIMCTLIWCGSSSAQIPLSFEEALATALENNYGIKIARNNKDISANNLTIGNAGFLPTLTANADRTYGRQSFERELTTGQEQSVSGARSQRTSYGASLNWTLFDGLRMFKTYDQLEAISLQLDDQFRVQVEQVAFSVAIAYYQAALENERLRLSKNNIELSEDRLRVAKDKYELGKASKLEYLQAQVDLNSDKTAKVRQMEALNLRKLDLLELMAMSGDTIEFELNYNLQNDQNIDLADIINSIETANPQLTVLRREQAIAMKEKEINESDRYPQVNLFAAFTHSQSESPAGFAIESTSDDLSYGVTASWTLFDGFNVQRRVQNAQIQIDNSQLAYQEQLLSLVTAARSRYINYRNNLNLMTLEEENVEVAKENNEIAQERYQIGLSNPIELREAQVNLINAELRLQNAAFAAKLAEIELKFLSGQLMQKQ